MRVVARTALLVVGLAACGNSSSMMGDDMQGTPDAAIAGGWTELLGKNWTLQPQSENESDLQIETLDRDVYISAIRPIAPPGTHHTLLFRGLTGTNAIYASGVGTGELEFPTGKGLKLTAGTTLGLQLHIYNTGDEVLTGHSGIEIKEVDAASITEEIDLFLPGPKTLNIPTGVSTTTGTCTVGQTQTLFALFPHMHQWGVHFKTTLNVNGVDQVLHDDDYTFEHQYVKTFAPIVLNAGDKIKTECTYNNTTGGELHWGESSDTEMCFSLLYRYPKQTSEFCQN